MSTKSLTITAMLTALLCLVGPLTLPLGPVPLSLTTGVLMLLALLFSPSRAALCCGLYVLIGTLGIPVFSGFGGGLAALAGPTGGFLLAYVPVTALWSWTCQLRKPWLQVLGLIGGTLLLYLVGTVWYTLQTGTGMLAAMMVCVLPFIPGDALKIAAVLTGGNAIQVRLKKAGMI